MFQLCDGGLKTWLRRMHADRNKATDGPELVTEPCTTAPPPQVEEERGKGWREGTWWPCLRILCISRDSRLGCRERRCRLWPPGGVPGPSQRERRRGLRNEGGDAAEQGGNGRAVRGLLEAITAALFSGSTCVLCQGLGKWGLLCGVSSDWGGEGGSRREGTSKNTVSRRSPERGSWQCRLVHHVYLCKPRCTRLEVPCTHSCCL